MEVAVHDADHKNHTFDPTKPLLGQVLELLPSEHRPLIEAVLGIDEAEGASNGGSKSYKASNST